MAWLRLTLQDGRTDLVNSDQVSEVYDRGSGYNTGVRHYDGVTGVRESVDEIAAMIEQAEWRERVLRCACAIMANQHGNGLTLEQVWIRAAWFASMGPERLEAKEQRQYACERCGGSGVQQAGCWTGKAYDSHAGRCELCDGKGELGAMKTGI